MSGATASLAAAAPEVLWLDDPDRPAPLDPFAGSTRADVVVVGGGYTGLWTALRTRERYPDSDVVLVDAGECGWQASGRNGGFAETSLTHGFFNGLRRWPEELVQLNRLGRENLAAIEESIHTHAIDCHFERTGQLSVATRPHEADELAEAAAVMAQFGHQVSLLDRVQTRAVVDSPTYYAGMLDDGCALVEPARLAWGLRAACLAAGVRIFEQTTVRDLRARRTHVEVITDAGLLLADRVALATNAFPPLLRRLRLMTVPVYDYVLATEPLSAAQQSAIGWSGRQGVGDSANLFHYYRLTRDNRILWGGYDAIYHYGSRIDPALEQAGDTHALLAEQFFETFPQLEGLRFTHRWAGVIDTCTRFSAFFGTAARGRIGYAVGYTGLGVSATRFGAETMLDLLHGEDTERTRLRMVREKPLPFPPEPARAVGINLTRRALAASDARGGHRNLWLRGLDAAGLGFDS